MKLPATMHIGRRAFLKTGTAALLTSLLPISAAAAVGREYKILSFYNIHTGETLKTCYRSKGRLVRRAIERISLIMRDHRTSEIKPVDPALLDLLHRVTKTLHPACVISIVSGYRSPQTNAALRKTTRGVARNSLHMQGRAIDIRISGCRTAHLRRMAIDLKCGGVGYYPESDFVHLDTGPYKVW